MEWQLGKTSLMLNKMIKIGVVVLSCFSHLKFCAHLFFEKFCPAIQKSALNKQTMKCFNIGETNPFYLLCFKGKLITFVL